MGDLVDVRRKGPVARVVMHRKGNNAIAEDLMLDLAAAFGELGADQSVRVIVLASDYEKYFSVGADLTSMMGIDRDAPDAADQIALFMRRMNHHFNAIERCPKPVIAAINGHAMGGGMEIAMACHFRLMKETARMGQTESNLGIIPGYGGSQRLPRLIGRTKALEFLILGTQIPAAECLQLRLVNRLCKEGETLNDAKGLARQLGKRAPLATAAIIKAVDEGLEVPMAKSIDVELEAFMPTLKSEDAAEGIQAFFGKREPQFKGK